MQDREAAAREAREIHQRLEAQLWEMAELTYTVTVVDKVPVERWARDVGMPLERADRALQLFALVVLLAGIAAIGGLVP